MTDAFGKELNIGDKVVYIRKYCDQVGLARGTIKSIKGRIAKVGGHYKGVMSQSVMKIEKE